MKVYMIHGIITWEVGFVIPLLKMADQEMCGCVVLDSHVVFLLWAIGSFFF